MVHSIIYPVLDLLLYPVFWLPQWLSLTAVSILSGWLLLYCYLSSSDQWAMAHYKKKMIDTQWAFFRGKERWENFKEIIRLNGIMIRLGLVPAVVCIGILLLMIPWIGNRFGYRPIQPYEPVQLTVTSSTPWEIEPSHHLRFSPDPPVFPAGTSSLRLLSEQPGNQMLLVHAQNKPETIKLAVQHDRGPAWPSITPPKWYSPVIVPAEQTLDTETGLEHIEIDYKMLFPSWTLAIPALGSSPGWLNYFFLISFASGIWAKFRWEVE